MSPAHVRIGSILLDGLLRPHERRQLRRGTRGPNTERAARQRGEVLVRRRRAQTQQRVCVAAARLARRRARRRWVGRGRRRRAQAGRNVETLRSCGGPVHAVVVNGMKREGVSQIASSLVGRRRCAPCTRRRARGHSARLLRSSPRSFFQPHHPQCRSGSGGIATFVFLESHHIEPSNTSIHHVVRRSAPFGEYAALLAQARSIKGDSLKELFASRPPSSSSSSTTLSMSDAVLQALLPRHVEAPGESRLECPLADLPN